MFFFEPKPGDLDKLKIRKCHDNFAKIYDGTFGIVLRVDNEHNELKQKYRVFSIKTLKEISFYETELKKFS